MAETFYLKGDSFTPVVYGGSNEFGLKSGNEQISADGTAIGGSVLDFDTGAISNIGVHYSGVGNWPNTPAVSVLMRIKFGSLSGTLGLFTCGGTTRANSGQLCMYISNTDFKVYMRDDGGSIGINNQTISTHGMSTGVWYDIVVTYTGDTTTDGFKAYVDGSLIGSLTSTRSWTDPRRKVYTGLALIQGENVNNGQCVVNEFAVFDNVINPNNIPLEGNPNGALNGASRSAFLVVTPTSASSGGSKNRINLGHFG
jgi:hypothetical protein